MPTNRSPRPGDLCGDISSAAVPYYCLRNPGHEGRCRGKRRNLYRHDAITGIPTWEREDRKTVEWSDVEDRRLNPAPLPGVESWLTSGRALAL